MLEYYSNDENYAALTGIIVENFEDFDPDVITIQITTPEHDYRLITNTNCQYFKFYTNNELLELLSVGDTIKFISAPMEFYNGHVLPIVSIEKQEEILLSFDEGKNNYLEWIKEAFS